MNGQRVVGVHVLRKRSLHVYLKQDLEIGALSQANYSLTALLVRVKWTIREAEGVNHAAPSDSKVGSMTVMVVDGE